MKLRFIAFTLVLFLVHLAPAQGERPTIRVGLEAVGTFSWIDFAMRHYGVDEAHGFRTESTTYATKQAKQIALQAGEADVVVDDITGVALWRAQGLPVRGVYPYSLATGGVVVRSDSDITALADLQGRRIAATDLGDKSLLILRTLALSEHGFDPQEASEIVAAAPPLMAELLRSGDVDAAIPPWHFVARMVGSGEYREVVSATEMLAQLGLSSDLPILIVVARDDLEPDLVRAYLSAMNETIQRMQQDEGIWDLILENELYSLPDPSLFPSVVERWERGVTQTWNQEVIDELVAMLDGMIALAGPDIVGLEEVSPDAFTAEFVP
jgi:NitT/TauT family transport system substrate-binding protein